MFQPLSSESDLPDVGAKKQFEGIAFDGKMASKPTQYELAKDVAAFANAEGGTILVGAIEDLATGIIVKYEPMTAATARAVRDDYNAAVKARCHPAPLIAPEIIPKGQGTFVVAVNVYPFPLQPVGVKVTADKSSEGYGGDAYTFPVRIGTHAQYLLPEQLGMFMEPKIRRMAVLLGSIPESARARVLVVDAKGAANPHMRSLDSVDPLGARVVFGPLPGKGGNFVVPFDLVRSVCQMGDGMWCVAYDGAQYSPSQMGYYVAIPLTH
jgi:hypothetical protein